MSICAFRIEISDVGEAAGVATIWLSEPDRPVVVINPEVLDRLEATLDALPTDAVGVVLASDSERAFVAGADLKSIMSMEARELDAYLARGQRVFGRLGSLACPTAAAIHGAALGGGLELAMHCDGLIGKAAERSYLVGLPEASLGLCPGWGGSQLLPARIDAAEAISRACVGNPMRFDEAVDSGLFDEVVGAADSVVDAAAKWVVSRGSCSKPNDGAPMRWLGREGSRGGADAALKGSNEANGMTEAGAAVLDCVRVGLESGWDKALENERGHLVRLRETPAAKSAIEAFFSRGKK